MKIASLFLAFLLGWVEGALACRVQTPLELLFAPWFRGPSFTDIASHANQFAGRTTLASGSSSVVVSTTNVKSDSLVFPHVEVALPTAYVVRGQTSIVSGNVSATASSSAIYSGMNVSLSMETATAQASLGVGLRVMSLVNGVSFAIATANSADVLGTVVAHWDIPEAKPHGIKVNTISEGGYFTLGWADDRPRPVDVTVMWEIKAPGKTTA